MKIGILTLPPTFNYGGILQAYALQKTLQLKGFDTVILDRRFKKKITLLQLLIDIKRIVWRCMPILRKHYLYDKRKKEYYSARYKPFVEFVNSRLRISQPLYSTDQLRDYIFKNGINCIIVGSDQVWRPQCSPCLSDYFLSFIRDGKKIIKVAYAASFGIANCEYDEFEKKRYGNLLQQFDRISVREDVAVRICEDFSGIVPLQVLDPTLLLPSNHYLTFFQKFGLCDKKKVHKIVVYILDKTSYKDNVIANVGEYMQTDDIFEIPINTNEFISISDWLRLFYEAEFIITDSFHGCVFSIIFNKPFIAVGNKVRGISRFTSLLKELKLQERLVLDDEMFHQSSINKEINWEEVNNILNCRKSESLNFLLDSVYGNKILRES